MRQNGSCIPCRKYWVADYTYTAKCPDGAAGGSRTVTRQGRSEISYEDARRIARDLAKTEAEADLSCTWEASACVTPTCNVDYEYPPRCRIALSKISQADADSLAQEVAEAAAQRFCQNGTEPTTLSGPGFNYFFPSGESLNFGLNPVVGGVGFEYRIDDGPWIDLGPSGVGAGIPVSVGSHYFYARAYDIAGGRGGTSSQTFEVA